MLISHKFKFIFIRIPKTASTSIQYTLGKICTENDIVTPINDPPILDHKARNNEGFEQHIAASQIKNKIPEDVWNNYFKFCFERNPYDKMVSMYWYRLHTKKIQGSFKEFCLNCEKGIYKFPNSSILYLINDKIAVDFIGRYEFLNDDFQKICNRIGLPFKLELTKLKSQIRRKDIHYSAYYDSETKEIVRNHYSKEIKLLGYKFEDKKIKLV